MFWKIRNSYLAAKEVICFRVPKISFLQSPAIADSFVLAGSPALARAKEPWCLESLERADGRRRRGYRYSTWVKLGKALVVVVDGFDPMP